MLLKTTEAVAFNDLSKVKGDLSKIIYLRIREVKFSLVSLDVMVMYEYFYIDQSVEIPFKSDGKTYTSAEIETMKQNLPTVPVEYTTDFEVLMWRYTMGSVPLMAYTYEIDVSKIVLI